MWSSKRGWGDIWDPREIGNCHVKGGDIKEGMEGSTGVDARDILKSAWQMWCGYTDKIDLGPGFKAASNVGRVRGREVFEWLYTIGGGEVPPPLDTLLSRPKLP